MEPESTITCVDCGGRAHLLSYPREDGGAWARVTDLELAPSSDPSDGAKLSLYVADYGADQANDGRLFEIDLGDPFWA